MGQPKLTVVPCDFDEAVAFVARHHRHHQPLKFHKFSLAVADEAGEVRAVCMVNRPTARMLDDGMTLEVTRLASDGCPNACSALYGAAWRAAKALGYGRLITYILDTEPGTTLKAAGWRCLGQRGGAVGPCRVARAWTSTRYRRNYCGKPDRVTVHRLETAMSDLIDRIKGLRYVHVPQASQLFEEAIAEIERLRLTAAERSAIADAADRYAAITPESAETAVTLRNLLDRIGHQEGRE